MFKLAGHLGKTVAELSATLSIDELKEWRAFDRVDPIGGYRGDLQAALIAYVQAGGKDSKLSDYLVVDPNPMTNEQRIEHERQQHIVELHQQTERLKAMFEKDN